MNIYKWLPNDLPWNGKWIKEGWELNTNHHLLFFEFTSIREDYWMAIYLYSHLFLHFSYFPKYISENI